MVEHWVDIQKQRKKNAIAISLILRYIPQHFRLGQQDCRGKSVDVDSMPGESSQDWSLVGKKREPSITWEISNVWIEEMR